MNGSLARPAVLFDDIRPPLWSRFASLAAMVIFTVTAAPGFPLAATAESVASASGSDLPDPLGRLAPLDTARRLLAAPAGFRRDDFDLLVNHRGKAPRAPSVVTGLLRDPARADSLVPALRRALSPHGEPSSRTAVSRAMVRSEALWPWLDAAPPARPAASGMSEANLLHPESVATRLHRGAGRLRAFSESLTLAEHDFLRREAPALFRSNADDTLLGPVARERERIEGEAVVDSVLALAERMPLPVLADAARDFDDVLRALLAAAEADADVEGFPTLEALLRDLRQEGIPVVFGTPGDDVHPLRALLAPLRRGIVFDPGGDDRYLLADMARPGGWLIILDVAGHDVYHAGAADDSTATAAAFASVQLIADLAGEDRYEGGDFAFGSAIAGYARVYDAAGDDRYTTRSASLGFAFHGLGVLQDRAGDDVYSSAFLSQGASSTFGFGLLLDEAGDDVYESRPEFLDDLRYRDRFLSLSQGFSTGFAPRHGGGLGVLWDRAGDDRYTADIFGQGAGYWFGWGLLMDDAGRDSITAYQYAQGAGIHFAAGMLLDGGGDDVRVSKGVSQGCGHDGGFGLFVDAAGNDRNTAVDMSAGAGSANGLGVMIDLAGDDMHAMGNPVLTLGHGDMRRDRASMGFFLDLGGRDVYPGSPEDPGKNAEQDTGAVAKALGRARPVPGETVLWRAYDGTKRGHGFGMDRESGE